MALTPSPDTLSVSHPEKKAPWTPRAGKRLRSPPARTPCTVEETGQGPASTPGLDLLLPPTLAEGLHLGLWKEPWREGGVGGDTG